MRIRYSQPKLKAMPICQQVHDILYSIVPPKYRWGLLVKVLVYTNKDMAASWRGNYRYGDYQGLYDDEWAMKQVDAVMTLKVGPECPHDKLVYLIAHETGHHIIRSQYQRGGEVKANKIAAKLISKYNKKGGKDVTGSLRTSLSTTSY